MTKSVAAKVVIHFKRRGISNTIFEIIHRFITVIYYLLVRLWKFGYRAPVGARIDADAYVRGVQYMQIGEKFHAGPHMWLEAVDMYDSEKGMQFFKPRLVIGRGVSFSWFGHIGCTNYIEIGNNVLFGSRCYITDHNHGIYNGSHPDSPDTIPSERPLTEDGEVIIGDRCWIGDNVVILPNVHIGEGVIIGANSVVTHDIPAETIAVGAPAKPVKRWDAEREAWVRIVY